MKKWTIIILVLIILSIPLYWMSRYNYNLFHLLIEFITIIISVLIVAITVSSFNDISHKAAERLGYVMIPVIILTFFHALSYKGMNIFNGYDSNLPTQLWICISYVQSIGFLIVILLLKSKLKNWIFISTYVMIGVGLIWACFAGMYPDCYIEGQGLTKFKIISEYIIIFIYILCFVLIFTKIAAVLRITYKSLPYSIASLMIAEFMFTLYSDVYGIQNFLGHYIRFIGLLILYINIYSQNIENPHSKLITDFRKSQKSLSYSEKNFRLMFEDAPLAYQSLDEEGYFITVNNAWLELLGYKRNEVIGKWFGDFIHPDLINHFKTNFPKFKYEGETCTVFDMPKKGGEMRMIGFNGRISYNEDGSFRQTHCILQDITDQEKAERLLRNKEQELRLLLEELQIGVIVFKSNLSILYVNPFAEKIFGLDNDMIVGESFKNDYWKLTDKNGIEIPYLAYPEAIIVRDKNSILNIELGLKTNSKKEITWLNINGFAINNNSKEIDRIVISFYDVSQTKKLEEERLLLESEIRNQQKLESIGTLAAGVAHEINNPINGILNYGQIILDEECRVDLINNSAKEIIYETNRVSTIVRNLLQFSRKEDNDIKNEQIGDIIERTLSLINTIIIKDNISLETDIGANLPAIKCNSQQIQQVLMNLLMNSRDALNDLQNNVDFQKKIMISCKEYNSMVRIAIEDNGTGIPDIIRDKIFDPFFTTKGRLNGTGLGLSISYGIVKEHNGNLSFETKEGEFTKFYLDLPI